VLGATCRGQWAPALQTSDLAPRLPSERAVLCFLTDEYHDFSHEPLNLPTRGVRQPRFRERMLAVASKGLEEAAQEPEHGDPLQLVAALGNRDVALRLDERLETMGVTQRLRRQRRHCLAESDVRLGERSCMLLVAECA
jgi:hypothetical protein